MRELTTNEVLKALESLGPVKLEWSSLTEKWYLTVSGLEIKDGPFLRGICEHRLGRGAAIYAFWNKVTDLPKDQYLVIDAYQTTRRAYRWNGFMWEHVNEGL